MIIPLKENVSDGNHSDSKNINDRSKNEKRKSQFNSQNLNCNQGESEDFTEDICLKKVKKSGDIIVLN